MLNVTAPPVVVPSPYPAIIKYARAIQEALHKQAWQTSVSPLTSIIAGAPGENPATLAPLIHSKMANLSAGSHASNVRPIHVAAMLASWQWFVVLIPTTVVESQALPLANPLLAVLLDNDSQYLSQVSSMFLPGQVDLLTQVSLKIDLSATDSNSWSILHWAVFGDAAEWCAANHRSPNTCPNDFVPRYTERLFRNHIHIFKKMANHRCHRLGFTPFDVAVVLDSMPTIFFYLKAGFVPEGTDLNHRTPLHLARTPECIEVLLTFAPQPVVNIWSSKYDVLGGPPWIGFLYGPRPAACLSFRKKFGGPTLTEKAYKMARWILQLRLQKGEISQTEVDSVLSLLDE